MPPQPKKSLCERVTNAADKLLKKEKSVGLIDVLIALGILPRVHFKNWQNGIKQDAALEDRIQCGSKKYSNATEHFLSWAKQHNLESFESTFELRGRHESESLKLTNDGDAVREQVLRTRFRSSNLTDAQKQRVEKKVNKTPDLMVYVPTGQASECSECKATLHDLLYLEKGNALCLDCADLAHLEFLPSGDATLTRRAKKLSPLSAIVVKFNRRRKRYDRQGILVTRRAIDEADAACEADAAKRAVQREKAAVRRVAADAKLVAEMTRRILSQFRSCPADEARQIATHTAERGSGRVGRSAAGRDLEPDAIRLAVRAWIRHQHTPYDSLLMQGVERHQARARIEAKLEATVQRWQS